MLSRRPEPTGALVECPELHVASGDERSHAEGLGQRPGSMKRMLVRRRQTEGVERIRFMAALAGLGRGLERCLGVMLCLVDLSSGKQSLSELATEQGPIHPEPDALLMSQRALLVAETFSDSASLDQQVSEHRVDASDPGRRLTFGLSPRALAPLDALRTVTRVVQHQRVEEGGIDAGLRLVGRVRAGDRSIAECTR